MTVIVNDVVTSCAHPPTFVANDCVLAVDCDSTFCWLQRTAAVAVAAACNANVSHGFGPQMETHMHSTSYVLLRSNAYSRSYAA